MKARPGVTLLEMIIVIGLSIMAIALLSSAFRALVAQVLPALQSANTELQAYAALECMARDVALSQVLSMQEEQLILNKSNSGQIKWMIESGKLIRMVGHYDEQGHRWVRKQKQTIAKSIQTIHFQSVSNGIRVMLTLVGHKSIDWYITRRVGVSL